MGMSERAVHINNLIALKDFCNNNGVFTLASNIEQSLDYAISSLKTDLKYDLMYEGEEIFTKDEVIDKFTELKTEIEKIEMDNKDLFVFESVNKFYEGVSASSKIVQQKIDKLKELNK